MSVDERDVPAVDVAQGGGGPRYPSAAELVRQGSGFLTRSHLRDLGLGRRAVDAVFRECPVIVLPGYSWPMVRVEAFLAFIDGHSYCDRCGDRVRPT